MSQGIQQNADEILGQRMRAATDNVSAASCEQKVVAHPAGGLVASYLLCSPFAPIRLNHQEPLTLGRDKSNKLVLCSREVSRFHAVVRWQQDEYVLEDLDSSNGTFVNEDYIERHALRNGDTIYIGANVLFYRQVLAGTAVGVPDTSLKDTVQIHLDPQMQEMGRDSSSFHGDIASLGLLSILQMLGVEKKTGCLTLRHEQAEAGIYFLNGVVIHSVCGQMSGRDGFMQLARWPAGQFSFHATVTPQEITMSDEIEWLLFEALRLIDEEKR
jgi:pSer/pThr/pTyr-binding forkhead associated (FHA) protein